MYYKVTERRITPVVDSYTINYHGNKYIAIREGIFDDEYIEYLPKDLEKEGIIKGKKNAMAFREKLLNKLYTDRVEESGYKVIEFKHTKSEIIYLEMYDVKTKVIYSYSINRNNKTMLPILNSDGTPKLYFETIQDKGD